VDYLTRRTLASVVAANTLAEMQRTGAWPAVGRSDTSVDMAASHWKVSVEVMPTSEQALRKVEVSVGWEGQRPEAAPLTRLTGFVGQY
jgi:hypothetical protein